MSSPRICRPILRRSNTINVSDTSKEEATPHEVKFEVSGWEVPKPTSSCQALRHAVSALTRIDDFYLEELGSGFFANVYKATHRTTGEEMVMKINKDVSNRHNALREVQLMNRLSHPNILRLLGVCVHEGQLHALTEFISGGTLEALLADLEEELPWTLRIKLALDIAKAVRYLHTEGVFHRDLTSKNVLIKKGENKNYSAIIADFGLATKIPDSQASEPLQAVGCPWWMAPEIINSQFYDQRADLFSFGIISCELTARVDADPETLPRTQSFGVDYVSFCQLFDYCPLDFLQLTFKCCQIVPDKRPDSNTIIATLEQIYRNLKAVPFTGNLHKRSRSEDNIIQTSDSEETLVTPQSMAHAMCQADPHWSPAGRNPFARLARFKNGLKLLDLPRSRYSSGSSSGMLSSSMRSCDLAASLAAMTEGEATSQSLPSSPVMLRRAAERHHQASLHGSDAVRAGSRPELPLSPPPALSIALDTPTGAADRRASFGCSRTRSLGALDVFSPEQSRRKKDSGKRLRAPENNGFCNIREASVEDGLDSDYDPFCDPQPDLYGDPDPDNIDDPDIFCDPPDFFEYEPHPMELGGDVTGSLDDTITADPCWHDGSLDSTSCPVDTKEEDNSCCYGDVASYDLDDTLVADTSHSGESNLGNHDNNSCASKK